MDIFEESLRAHKEWRGKLEITSKVSLSSKHDLSVAYTPGVAEPCKKIHDNLHAVYEYTGKGNMVAVITDGTAVFGLGDIGPYAGLPVMEGKAVLFKSFANVDAFPICINSKKVEDIVNTIKLIEPSFGGINLEDISSPRCVEIERALKIVKKDWKDIKIASNQINNVLVFPCLFRGALDARASEINEEMKKAAAFAIAELITEKELCEDYVIVPAFDERVGKVVSDAVYKVAVKTGVS